MFALTPDLLGLSSLTFEFHYKHDRNLQYHYWFWFCFFMKLFKMEICFGLRMKASCERTQFITNLSSELSHFL